MRDRLAAQIRDAIAAAPSMTAAALLSAVIAAGGVIALTNSDTFITRGFETALAMQDAGDGFSSRKLGPLVSGSEDFWLKRARADGARAHIKPAAWTHAAKAFGVAVGDRITIASQGVERSLEVIEVSEIDANVTRIDTGGAPSRQLLVTCRDTSAGAGHLVRFVTEGAPAAGPARAL